MDETMMRERTLALEGEQLAQSTAAVKSTTFYNSPPTPLRVLESSLQWS